MSSRRSSGRAYVRNAREAAASLDLPALGLAKPSIEDFSDELINLTSTRTDRSVGRVLPDGGGGAAFSCEWRLREHEVVLLVGCTPPPAKYFGITPYVYKSYDAGIVRTLFASAGDTLAVGGDDGSGTARFARLGTSAARVERMADGTMGVVRDARCWNSTFAAAFGGHTRVLSDAIDVLRTHAENARVPVIENALNAYGLSRQTGVKTRADDTTRRAVQRERLGVVRRASPVRRHALDPSAGAHFSVSVPARFAHSPRDVRRNASGVVHRFRRRARGGALPRRGRRRERDDVRVGGVFF